MHISSRIGKPFLIAAALLALGANAAAAAEDGAAPGLLLGPWSATAPQQRIVLAQAAAPKNEFKLTGTEWHFNLKTKDSGFSMGTWLLQATLQDGSVKTVWITIKK